jgi:hypothetical protein
MLRELVLYISIKPKTTRMKNLLLGKLLTIGLILIVNVNLFGQYDVPVNYPSINAAIAAAPAGSTINVAAGNYNEDVVINKTLTLTGAGAASTIISGPIGGGGSTISIAASNVIVEGFTITRDGNNTSDWNNPGLNSGGVTIQGQALTGSIIRHNVFTGMRTAIDINNSNGHTVHENVIDFNRTGMIFRNQTDNMVVTNNHITNNWTVGVLFLDQSGGSNSPVQTALNSLFNNNNISGNWYGQVVDRQTGGALPAPGTTNKKNFSCNWYGTVNPVVSTANSAEPAYAGQTPVAYGGTATPPGGQPDILGAASANIKYMPFLANGTDNDPAIGFQPVANTCFGCSSGNVIQNVNTSEYFCSIQEAIDDAQTLDGHTISVGPGVFVENVVVHKQLVINGAGQAATIVYPSLSSPASCAGSLCPTASNVFLVRANNVTIQNLTVDGDNPALTSGVVANGADLDARNGIITDHLSDVYNNLNVNHTTVRNIYLRGIYASSGGSFTIDNNTVDNVSGEYASIAIFNVGGSGNISNNIVLNSNDAIAANHSKGTNFTANAVTNSGTGIHSDNNGSSGGVADVIENNTVSNSPQYGYGIFVFSPYRAVQVKNNTVTNVEVGLTSAGSYVNAIPVFEQNTVDGQNKANSIGVYSTTEIWWYPSGNQSTIFKNNFIRNNNTAFLLASEAGFTNSTTANENSITGNTTWVKLVKDYTEVPPTGNFGLNFTCNWWGTINSTEIAAKVPSTVDYTPYLINGTDNAPGTPGFQPVPNSCNGYQYVDCSNKKEKKVIVCHNGKSTCISLSALATHLAHGDVLGPCNTSRGEEFITDLVEEFNLLAAPNPASNSTTIAYELPVDCKVNITLFDPMGRVVSVLVDAAKPAGSYNYQLDVSKLAAGIYYYKMSATSNEQKFLKDQKLVIIK